MAKDKDLSLLETDHSTGRWTDYIGTVRNCWFATDANYQGGEALLMFWELDVVAILDDDREAFVDSNGDEVWQLEERFSCGRGWFATDPTHAEHEKGDRARFQASSFVGRMIDSVTGRVEGLGDGVTYAATGEPILSDLSDAVPFITDRDVEINPANAEFWVGWTVEMREVAFDFGKRRDGTEIKTVRNFPVRFVSEKEVAKLKGEKSDETKAKARAKANAGAKDEPAPAPDNNGAADKVTGVGIDSGDDDFAAIVAAIAANDRDALVEAALENHGDKLKKLNALLG